ncbi:MAG: hypothetical protein QGF00_08780 [Planctomycetota bacterium]|jgi:hypothetical protein|nr:hypothetical protein [Planctomycetota bacterium]MDP7249680.1 hypothetical protein [Planctomycetota bacterium]
MPLPADKVESTRPDWITLSFGNMTWEWWNRPPSALRWRIHAHSQGIATYLSMCFV